MGGFLIQNDFVIIKKHFVMIMYNIAKFLMLLLITVGIFTASYFIRQQYGANEIVYTLYVVTLCMLHYTFIKLVLGLIFYYNDLVIFLKDKIIIVKSSLLFQDDLEIIDISKVQKIDVKCHGFFPTLFGYGNLYIEQQGDVLRVLHFIPSPYKALQLLREKTAYLNVSQDVNFFKLK